MALANSAIEPSNAGLELVRKLDLARRGLEHARGQVRSSECEVHNAENELVKWLVPKNANAGDVFVLPVGDAFLEVRVGKRELRSTQGGAPSTFEPTFAISWRDNRKPEAFIVNSLRHRGKFREIQERLDILERELLHIEHIRRLRDAIESVKSGVPSRN